jgi:hypothetical protein
MSNGKTPPFGCKQTVATNAIEYCVEWPKDRKPSDTVNESLDH